MSDALIRDGKLDAAAIEAATAAAVAGLAAAGDPMQRAALAIVAGRTGTRADLAPLLASDQLDGQAAAWAMGRLGDEAALLRAAADGDLDTRTNAYHGLVALAAAGKASPAVAPAMVQRAAAENERARGGRTGLGEHACRVLAALGAAETLEAIQSVMDADRFCDKFELSRLRKIVQDKGRDVDAVAQYGGAWSKAFADHLAPPPAAAKPAAPAGKPTAKPAAAKPAPAAPPADAGVDYGAYAPPGAASGPTMADDMADDALAEDDAGMPADDDAAAGPGGAAKPIDWKAFLASPEAAALTPAVRQLAGQLCPMLEQLALRAVRAPLTDLNAQEFAAVLLQVLPQVLPPQHVQMALSPQAMNAYQAMAKFLVRTKAAAGDDLLQAIRLVRQQMAEQIRRAGILNGPDYSDPDAKPSVQPA